MRKAEPSITSAESARLKAYDFMVLNLIKGPECDLMTVRGLKEIAMIASDLVKLTAQTVEASVREEYGEK